MAQWLKGAIFSRLQQMKSDDEKTKKNNMMLSCEKQTTIVKDAYELLECPVCTIIMSPPTHQCPNGHALCSNCKIKVKSCPICCLALEIIIEPLEVPYYCPCDVGLSKCPVSGNIPKLVAHLKDDHNVKMHDGSIINQSFILFGRHTVMWESHIFNCYGQQFCLHFQAFFMGNLPCYIAFLGFMGEETEAKNFTYSLEVSGGGRKCTWKAVPRSIHDSFTKICGSLDGLLIRRDAAFSFSDGNTKGVVKLLIKGYIYKAIS